GYTQSKPAGTDCKTLANDVADGGYPVSVSSSGTISGKDFGNFTTGSVSGTKFEDRNANGTQDAGDQGLGSWTIRAYNAAGAIADSTSTANDGSYTLHLSPGTYTICEVQQSGYPQSKPAGPDCKKIGRAAGREGTPNSQC